MLPHRPLGVLGGMGPGATVLFLDLLFRRFHDEFDAVLNSDFPKIVLRTVPLSDHMGTGNLSSTTAAVLSEFEKLTADSVDFVVCPCNAAHQILERFGSPKLLSILGAVRELAGWSQAGGRTLLLSTRVTRDSGLYQNLFFAQGRMLVLADEEDQALIDRHILAVNAGPEAANGDRWVPSLPAKYDADSVLIACTELSHDAKGFGVYAIDTLRILVEAAFLVSSRQRRIGMFGGC